MKENEDGVNAQKEHTEQDSWTTPLKEAGEFRYMSFAGWLIKEKKLVLGMLAFFCLCFCLLSYAFKVSSEFKKAVLFLLILFWFIVMIVDYYKRKLFYQDFLNKLHSLDKKYLITEMMKEPQFYEGKLFKESLYEINKTMVEHIAEVELASKEWREYVEQWIHEIKLPISALELMNYNETADSLKEEQYRRKRQIQRLKDLTEKILFFSRADMPWKDYLIKQIALEKIVNNALLNQKDSLIEGKIRIEKEGLGLFVLTDAKWLEFIIGQVINNSIKYVKKEGQAAPVIRFFAEERAETIRLTVEDNGIGIARTDLPRVFEKTFTGENGRADRNATGMGLYISKKMCKKLGHQIRIESKKGEYTRVIFEFGKDNYYQML